MNGKTWQSVEMIFNQTILLSPEQRLDSALKMCGDDEELFDEVSSLLKEAEKSEDFLSQPIFSLGTQLLAFDPVGLLQEPDFASYHLESILGRGGNGVVFLARDKKLERHVALKVLPYSLSENDERIRRFQREAKAASSISHPNVAHIYEFGKAKDRFFIAMEYVSGQTLRTLLKAGPIDTEKVLSIAIQTTKALRVAHRSDIIHRDIKPENIIINEENLVKILDFGLAKTDVSDCARTIESSGGSLHTTPGMIFGTVGYMSPEQVRGLPLDARSDIWSLGVVLYEMLDGNRPFDGATQSDVQAQILLSEPVYNGRMATIPSIKKILSKMLCKKVEDRYQNTSDILNDLGFVFQKLGSSALKKELHLSFADEDETHHRNRRETTRNTFFQKIRRFFNADL